MKAMRTDPVLLITGTLIVATLMAFFGGWFSYPFGIIVLSVFLFARISQLRSRNIKSKRIQ